MKGPIVTALAAHTIGEIDVLTRKTALRSKTQLKTRAPMKSASPGKLPGKLPGKSKLKPSSTKTSKIRQSAKGEQCLVRVPGVCNGNSATTVLAHLNGAGVGYKHGDHKAAYACSACHSWLDGGYVQSVYGRTTRDLWHLESVIRTQDRLIEKGFIQVIGSA